MNMIKYFDTHAHFDDRRFNSDREELFPLMHKSGVEYIVNPGCEHVSSRQAIDFAEKYDFVHAAVGYHPGELSEYSEKGFEQIVKLATHPKCVAIGEIGLDYYWDDSRKAEQKVLFRRQIELALELCKPVIIHDREAHADTLEILADYPGLRGVLHCYSGSAEMAKELLKRGWYLGFDGPVTYKNARKTLEVIEVCPLERILIETDSPYLTPVPFRGKRNDSRNLCYVAEKIAEIKGESLETVAEITLQNGKKLFNIK